MKHTVRSFSVGLLAAGLIMLIVYYFFEDSSDEQLSISTDEMISQLEEEGYRVLTENEYISYSVANAKQNDEESDEDASVEEEENTEENETTEEDEDVTENEEENTEDQNVEEENEEEEVEEENTPSSVTINIPSGMASLDLSRILEEENLIDDAEEFSIYLQQNGYALRLQLGEHELTTDMSDQEIAETLTN